MILGWELSCLLGPMRSGEVDIFLRPFPTAWLWCCGNQPVISLFFFEAKEDKTWTEKMKNDIRKIEMFKLRHFIKDISGCTLKIEYL